MYSLRTYILTELTMGQTNAYSPDSGHEYDLKQVLYDFHEFSYKYFKVKDLPIHNLRRKENMLNILDNAIHLSGLRLASGISRIFHDWLKKHAILNPHEWAEARFEDSHEMVDDPEYEYKALDDEYRGIKFETYQKPHSIWSYQSPLNDIDFVKKSVPTLYKYLKVVQKEQNEYNQEEGEEAQSLDSILEMILDGGQDSVIGIAKWNYSYYSKIMKELYSSILFPLWMKKWGSQGIVQTRHNIERVTKEIDALNNNTPVGNFVASITLALNSAHQTGSMLDYLETIGIEKSSLDDLTGNKTIHHAWDKELAGD